MGEMKRARELRVDELSVQKLRESHETILRLTSQMQEMQEQMNSMNDSGEFQEVESNYSGRLSHVPSQPAAIPSPRSMLSCDKRLQLETSISPGLLENVFANPRSTLEPLRTPYQGIHPIMAPNAAGEAPALISTGRLVAREEERIVSHNSNADICKKAADHELLYSCGYSTEFYCWAAKILFMLGDKIQKPGDYLFWFSLGGNVMDQRTELVDSVDD